MKKIRIFVLLLTLLIVALFAIRGAPEKPSSFYVVGESTNSLSFRIRDAEVIAFVRIERPARKDVTNVGPVRTFEFVDEEATPLPDLAPVAPSDISWIIGSARAPDFALVAPAGIMSALSTIVSTNPAGRMTTNYFVDATVERVLKGKPPKSIRLKDGSADSVFSYGLASRYLVLVKRSGDFYTPASGRDLMPTTESPNPGMARVGWGMACMSEEQAIAIIQKYLKE